MLGFPRPPLLGQRSESRPEALNYERQCVYKVPIVGQSGYKSMLLQYTVCQIILTHFTTLIAGAVAESVAAKNTHVHQTMSMNQQSGESKRSQRKFAFEMIVRVRMNVQTSESQLLIGGRCRHKLENLCSISLQHNSFSAH